MIDEIYNKQVLGFAAQIGQTSLLEEADATASAHSKLCGSRVKVSLKVRDGRVSEYGQEVRACALGQASAAIMARHIIGTSATELFALRDEMHAMLKQDGAPPQGKWAELEALRPVKDFKARQASTLLVFDAVCDALESYGAETG